MWLGWQDNVEIVDYGKLRSEYSWKQWGEGVRVHALCDGAAVKGRNARSCSRDRIWISSGERLEDAGDCADAIAEPGVTEQSD